MTKILGQGIYSISEAAKLARVSPQKARAWFSGWKSSTGPVLHSDYAEVNDRSDLISFLDLIEVAVASSLRSKGFSLQYLRRAYQQLTKDLATNHPFSHRKLMTDGKKLFLRAADQAGDVELREVVERQYAFDPVLRPYLDHIDWDRQTLLAKTWRISDGVIIDPARRFGKPIVLKAAISTSVLAAAYAANGRSSDLVAAWYGVEPDEVEKAVAFENHFSGRAA